MRQGNKNRMGEKRMNKTKLTQQRLKELIDYSKDTGIFKWRVAKGRSNAGDVCGTINRCGASQIRIDGVKYSAHRLAFLYVDGKLPGGYVCHTDSDGANNKFSNIYVKNSKRLTQKELKSLVTYNKDSGIFRWKNDDLKGGIKKGTVCGTDVPGERSRMVINNKRIREDRLAFIYMTGKIPKKRIIHKNGHLDDNRWENLELLETN